MKNIENRIIVTNVSKEFRITLYHNKSTLSRFIGLFKKMRKKEIKALKNISLKVKPGECIGIIGRNASGKSTLLRVIAGIYCPDRGKVRINGKIVYLTGFGQGLQRGLTMRENIFLSGSLMGLSQKDIKKRFNEIVDFSGLKDYLDSRVYQFSSGMLTRLGFSIGIYCLKHQNPDILLLDEVFDSGGDLEFKEKASKKMEELIKSGASVILVSHNFDFIKKYCQKAILLSKGEIVYSGNPKKAVKNYLKIDQLSNKTHISL